MLVRTLWSRSLTASLIATALVALSAAPTFAVEGLDFTTPYPAVGVDPGGEVTFPLAVSTEAPERVGIEIVEAPEGFETTLRGGGFIVDAIFTDPDAEEPAELELAVTVPEDAAPGDYQVLLRATGSAGTTDLPLDLSVGEAEGGSVSLTTEFPNLRGSTEDTFSFSLTLENDTAQEITFGLEATGQPGWDVEAQLSGEEQAATAVVAAGETASVNVTATPPEGAPADLYPILVRASGGSQSAEAELSVELTGSYSMDMFTPDERLDVRVTGGGSTTLGLVVENTGTADLTGVTIDATPPTDWEVTFEPETLEGPLAPLQQQTFTATITPSANAVAGDYSISFSASATEEADADLEIRTTVETSSLWGFVGLALIALVVIGLFLVFRQYGRR